jgi:deazaflavin-dependent oxidoreductase (nitroreductase family)
MSDMNDFNQGVIAEFRANDGVVGGPFEGLPMMLLTNTGAKSGLERINPLCCTVDDGDVVIIASKGGAPSHPDWYRNIVANPSVTVEFGTEKYAATAQVVADEADRQRLYDAQVALMPQFGEYAKNTTRVIPVVRLVRN